MILDILKFVHVVLAVVGLGAGICLLYRVVSGGRIERWAVLFLKCSLLACATGILLSLYPPGLARWGAVLAVYASGLAVLALRKFHLAGPWAPTFVLSLISVLCLDFLVAVVHLFRFLSAYNLLPPEQTSQLLFFTASIVMLFFAALGIFAVRRYCNKLHSPLALYR
jgi:hypothetical protein